MKWVRLAYGLGAAHQHLAASIAESKRRTFITLKEARVDNRHDQPRDKMRSIDACDDKQQEAAKKRIANAEKAKKKKEKEGKKRRGRGRRM